MYCYDYQRPLFLIRSIIFSIAAVCSALLTFFRETQICSSISTFGSRAGVFCSKSLRVAESLAVASPDNLRATKVHILSSSVTTCWHFVYRLRRFLHSFGKLIELIVRYQCQIISIDNHAFRLLHVLELSVIGTYLFAGEHQIDLQQ